jgi:hypothetical protein
MYIANIIYISICIYLIYQVGSVLVTVASILYKVKTPGEGMSDSEHQGGYEE